MKISDFFNPQSLEHMMAYKHLQEKGFWPEGFIPERMEFEPAWQIILQGKMAEEYMKQLEKGWDCEWMEG
jgi:hypothetical protein